MIKTIPLKTLHIVVIICVIIYTWVQWMKYGNYAAHPFIYNHLNDLIVIPIIATICLYVIWLLKKSFQLRIGIFSLLSLVILYSVYFEYYLPKTNYRYTGDVRDIFCYATGAVIFYIVQKLP